MEQHFKSMALQQLTLEALAIFLLVCSSFK